jgi:hypothetical protein
MPSNYAAFDVKVDNDDGTETKVPDATVKIYDATNVVDLGEITADSDGHIDGGTLPVDAGTVIRFRVENYLSQAGYLEQVTT